MKKELNPGIVAAVLVVIVGIVVYFGYMKINPPYREDKVGSEKLMEKVKGGEPMYSPPSELGLSTGKAGAQGGASGGMYNMTPPPR